MRDEYDFSGARKNPYAKKLKNQITIRIDAKNIEYFKNLSDELNIPYQTLINSFLSDCVSKKLRPSTVWEETCQS